MKPRRRRRAFYYLGAFVGVTILYTVGYMLLMATIEGETRTFSEALLIVIETFTTTGYGEDAVAWSTPELRYLMVSMQFTGVFFIFMALPLFVAPWIEERLTTTVPTAVEDLTDHVVISSHTPRTAMLIEELSVYEVPYVVIESDRELATELYEDGVDVIIGDPESAESLADANLSAARAVVTDIDDETNASVALTARQVCENGDVRIISFVEDPDVSEYHDYAGVDDVLSPRQLIGESLAHKVTMSATTDVGDAVEINEDFELVELPVQAGSDLDGVRLQKSNIRERTGANIVGAWFRGEFVSPPSPDAYIDAQTVLLVAGREQQLEHLKELTLSETKQRRFGDVVICGHGEVGSTVKQIVTSAGLPCTTIDTTDRSGVDVVGDATEEETLRSAGVPEANTVIVALPDDTLSVFATLVIQKLNPDAEIVVRASETRNVEKLYRAGADYVLALATVSGRMLASTILEEEVISFDQGIEIVRMEFDVLAGMRLDQADIRAQTGCTVLAVERDGQMFTELGPSFTFQAGDEGVVAGPDMGVLELSRRLSE